MNSLVHPKERIYFTISILISILLYIILIVSVVGMLYIAIGGIVAFIMHGLLIGNIKGNGIRVSERQFPEVYSLAKQLAEKMALNLLPAIYVVQEGGFLNAFATKFLGRNFVIIYSDVLELAYEQGESALAFVICHELAHIKRRYLAWRWFLYPAMFIPFLGTAYSRACEYTCDRIGAHHSPDGAMEGLLVLAAGKKLYRNVNVEEFSSQLENEGGFWVWLSEKLSTHPNLCNRVRVLKERISALRTEQVIKSTFTI